MPAQIKTVGFVGLGKMGTPMVRNLAAGGFQVIGCDRDATRRARLETEENIHVTDVIADAAGADALILMLPSGAIVRDVLIGEGGAAGGVPEGGLVIDMSSSDPAVYEDIAPVLEGHCIDFVDAPVSGNIRGAAAASLTIMAGGSKPAIERAEPIFECLGEMLFWTGSLGTGQVMKALNNTVSAGALILTIEALLVARRAGLDPHLANSVLNTSTGRNNATDRKIEPFVLSRQFNSGFDLALMAKDLETARSVTEARNVSMPLAARVIAMAAEASKALGPDADHTEIARWLEERTGMSLDEK